MDIKELLNKNRLNPEEVQIVFTDHRKHFDNRIILNANCPSCVRAAVKRLKQHYDRG